MSENIKMLVASPATLRARPVRALYPDAPAIAVYADANEDNAQLVARVCATEGLGAVHQVKLVEASRLRRATALAHIHEANGANPRHLMFDAARYHGKNRDVGVTTLSAQWIDEQRRIGCRYALTDSPYIPEGDVGAVISVLSQAAALSNDDVLAVLPLHDSWLKKHSQDLLELIERYRVPVGLVLEHRSDPLGVKANVAGLIQVLSSTTKVALLRTDLSAIGAVAYNAAMGAIGTRASLRHLGNGGSGRYRGPSAYVPHSMVFRLLETINNAMAIATDNPEWFECDCQFCGGRPLDYILTPQQAYLHTMAAAAGTAQHVLGMQSDPTAQRTAWLEMCREKQFVNLELDAQLGGGWNPPDFHGAWLGASS